MPYIASFLLCLLGLLCAAVLLAASRAIGNKNRAPRRNPRKIDPQKAQRYAQHLSQMLQCQTISAPDIDPATTADAFVQLRQVLKGSFPLVFSRLEEIPIEEAMLLRWRGRDSARDAMLLLAHSDVVPATGRWARPPFGGEIADGMVWGRGAMDTKNTLCAILEATEALLQEGFVPVCDVYIGSSHNEEKMGPGAVRMRDWFVENDVALAMVSDEGGSVVQHPMPGLQDGLYAMMGLLEKGFANVQFIARSTGGHASIPPKNSPIARLSAFVSHVEKRPPFKTDIPAPIRMMMTTLAPYMRFGQRMLYGNLWLFAPLVKWLLPRQSAQGAAMLRTTCAFTMSSGSAAPNIIPETATITANVRSVPHQNTQQSLQALREVAARYDVEMEVLYQHDIYPAVDTESPGYRHMLKTVRAAFPEAVASPYVMLAATDSRHFAQSCPCVLRFSPAMLSPAQLAGMHGLDEHSGIDALARAVDFYTLLIQEYS